MTPQRKSRWEAPYTRRVASIVRRASPKWALGQSFLRATRHRLFNLCALEVGIIRGGANRVTNNPLH